MSLALSLSNYPCSKNICANPPNPRHPRSNVVCIFTNNALFTGDTLLNNTKTPLTFPHSNRKDYANSLQKLKTLIKPGTTIYPGHGEVFVADGFLLT